MHKQVFCKPSASARTELEKFLFYFKSFLRFFYNVLLYVNETYIPKSEIIAYHQNETYVPEQFSDNPDIL